MRAISKIMLLIDADINHQQVSVLKNLAEALESG